MMNAVPSLRRRRSVRGFTLVELLTVIAIIGILATILIPAVGGVRKKAGMTKSSSNLRQIGLSYQAFSDSGSRKINVINEGWESGGRKASTPGEFAQVLADRAGLNDAAIYTIDMDGRLGGVQTIPRQIVNREGTTVTVNTDWESLAGTPNNAVAYEFVANIASNASPSTTPLAWTRGLKADGYWDDAINPWGNQEGGHILFLDGHVEYHDNLIGDGATQGVLINRQGQPTINIEDAINPTNVSGTAVPVILKYSGT